MNIQSSYKITYLTFVANLLIVLEHASFIGIVDCNSVEAWIMDFCRLMAVPMMSYFFFVSAYFFFRGVNKTEDFWKRIRRRIQTLIVPYLIWNLLGGVFHIIGGDYPNFNLVYFLKDSFLFINGRGCGDGPLWYIFRLMTYIVISPLVYLVIKKKKYMPSLILCLSIIAVNYIFKVGYYDYTRFLPIYIVGAFCGLNFSNEFEKFIMGGGKQKFPQLLLLLLLYVVGTIVVLKSGNSIINLMYPFAAIIELCCILNCLGTVEKPCHIIAGTGMFLYCAHDLVYRVIRTILLGVGTKFVLVDWLVLILASLLVMLAIWKIMDKYLPSFLSVLCGGRNKR